MDTPDSKSPSASDNHKNKNNCKLINPSSSDSPAVHDSPVFNFISNLSPIQPVKAAPASQGFPGLASPPLVFTSPRITLQTSFLTRQLQSSTSNLEFSEENDECLKNDGHPNDSTKVDLSLKIRSICSDETGHNTKNSIQVEHHSAFGFLDGCLANPMECRNSSNQRLFVDSPQSSKGGCLLQKDKVPVQGMVLDGSALPKFKENAQAQAQGQPSAKFKLVKLEPRRLVSASSKSSSIFPKLSSGHTNEVSHLECGSLRRCLFDENQRKYSSDRSDSQNPNDDLMSIQQASNTSSSGTVERRQIINLSKLTTSVPPSPSAGNYPVAISKPLGIGLHLNSVVYPGSTDNATSGQQSSEKVVRVIGKTSVFVANNQSAGKVNGGSVTANLIRIDPAHSEAAHKNEASLAAASGNSSASEDAQHFEDPILLKPDDPSAIVHKRRYNSESVETNEKLLGSPKKKRKKSSGTPDDDPSKRCNCKQSKCLKLYCDCFAAGLYCAESCACQGCFNRAEYEDTVLETRQQIESRNPLAFAPKVVQLVAYPPAKELGNLSTPSTARHKKGCNCKRSMCVKKYCECYQSNVGCSDGCRCEGCKNVYGKREDHIFAREFMIKKVANETRRSILDEKEESLSSSNDNIQSRLHSSPHVSPVTPALHCSDQKLNALKSRLPFRRFLQPPDSDHDMPPSEASACPGNLPSDSMLLEESGRSMDDVSSSKLMDLRHVPGPDTSGSELPPPSSLLRWRSSPMTPVTESARSEYLQDFDPGSKHSHMLEDDTPEILKDSATCSGSVKVRSPNKKRVSPPHHHTAPPDSLKICHKYVLKAVSRFPPLTPYSRNSGDENTSESLD